MLSRNSLVLTKSDSDEAIQLLEADGLCARNDEA
jgi:hypothetical protein